MGYRATFLLLRRLLEEAVFENVVLRLEEALDEAGVERPRDTAEAAIAFADLSGFTRLTLQVGDAVAAEQSSRFIALGARASQLLKGLSEAVPIRVATVVQP
jgi:adenylate cyclase